MNTPCSLPHHRKKIDRIDEKLLTLLSERVRVCEAIAIEKSRLGKTVQDKRRERELFHRAKTRLGSDRHAELDAYAAIIGCCRTLQETVVCPKGRGPARREVS